MGYDNHFTGAITITPPLTWAEIRLGPAVEDVRLRIIEEIVDTPTGQVRTVTADAIIPRAGTYTGAIPDDIQTIVSWDAYAGHEFAGYIEMQLDPGFDDPLPRRYVVRDGRTETVTPRLVWPDDEPPPEMQLPQVWSISGATYDYPERFATRELAQAAAEIEWCNENGPDTEPVFAWAEGDEVGVFEALIDGIPLEWAVQAHPLIWSRPTEEGEGE